MRPFVRKLARSGLFWALAASGTGCESTPAEPQNPTWADVAPIFRGACDSCHGWTAPRTGGDYRFDFFDMTKPVCGEAALALTEQPPAEQTTLAGAPTVPAAIGSDVVTHPGAAWPEMPPQPSPALPDWELGALVRWAAQPTKGPPPPGNRPPTIAVGGFPATAKGELAFTAVLDDPDGDSVVGVIEVNHLAFLMNRPGSFAVALDASTWPAGPQDVTAILCDGWTSATYDLGPVQIEP